MRFRGVHSRAFIRNRYVSCLYKELGSFVFGCCVCQSLTNMAKLSVGRLRPYFLSICNITYASINCTLGSYVAQVNCRQPNHKLVEEARYVVCAHESFSSEMIWCVYKRWGFPKLMCNVWHLLSTFCFRKSFFSGHASFAMYTMLYLAVSNHNSTKAQKHIWNVTLTFTWACLITALGTMFKMLGEYWCSHFCFSYFTQYQPPTGWENSLTINQKR